MASTRLLLFDCDSTLSALEGIDELGRLKGPDVFRRVEAMTNDAMDGRLAVEAVFGRRLDIILPRAEDLLAVGARYLETMEPTACAVVSQVRREGWTPMIVSGGFRGAIRPLADRLEIERIEAVDLTFDRDGSYLGFDRDFPTTRSGGKPEIVSRLRRELNPVRVVMVGDGVSDLETKPVVDLFVGFGRYVQRERVRRESAHFITSLDQLPALLQGLE
ncbi:MAG: HAD-IB family phosphatase [Opitutaceae bacterium]|nr:HAD-IB family phosphatase [Opitutaceae bacterium]